MKRKLLFLAPYPDTRYPKEGMFNRIISIDSHFKNEKRTYLYASLNRHFKKFQKIEGNLEIIELNIFIHFFKIVNILFSSENIYSHSIHMVKNVCLLIILFRRKIILDAHGAVPEEIEFLEKKSFLYYLLLLTEKIIFSKKNVLVVCVTNSMKNHFNHKYPKFNGKYLVYSIFPEQLYFESIIKNRIDSQINTFKNDKLIVIYSGGTAGWQKVDLMFELIERNQTEKIEYIILTVEVEKFKQISKNYKIPEEHIIIKSVAQNELSGYYEIADYGFILRDDNVVNNVANPTKLVEYLFYGIIPIVLTPNIGDYNSYGFEYLSYEKFDSEIEKPNFRSKKNIEIAKKLMDANLKIDIKSLVLGSNE